MVLGKPQIIALSDLNAFLAQQRIRSHEVEIEVWDCVHEYIFYFNVSFHGLDFITLRDKKTPTLACIFQLLSSSLYDDFRCLIGIDIRFLIESISFIFCRSVYSSALHQTLFTIGSGVRARFKQYLNSLQNLNSLLDPIE
jgi:hypothetical protein